MLRKGILVALTLGMGLGLARMIKNSQVPPREMRPKAPRTSATSWTWARFDGEPGGPPPSS